MQSATIGTARSCRVRARTGGDCPRISRSIAYSSPIRRNASTARGERFATYTSWNLRRACAQQAVSRTRLPSYSEANPLYPSACSVPAKHARCDCGHCALRSGE
jgi:hypothetical protein